MNNRKKLAILPILGMLTLSLAQPAAGQITIWTNLSGGDFYDTANWFGGVPDSNLDGVFDVPATYEVELTRNDSVRNLTFQNGLPTFVGGQNLTFAELLVEPLTTNVAPDVTFRDNIALTGDSFILQSTLATEVIARFEEGASLEVDEFLINAVPTGGAPSRVNSLGSEILATDASVIEGNLNILEGSNFVASIVFSVGVGNNSPTPALLTVIDSFMEADTTEIGNGLIALMNSDITSSNVLWVGASPGFDGGLLIAGDCVIDSPSVLVGEQSTGLVLLSPQANLNVTGSVDINDDGELTINEAEFSCDHLAVNGDLIFTNTNPNSQATLSSSTMNIDNAGIVSVDPLTIASIDSLLNSRGSSIDVGIDAELRFDGGFRGTNTFTGNGTICFESNVNPNDLSDATSTTGELDFFGTNVFLKSNSNLLIELDSGAAIIHDKLNVNAGISIGGSLTVEVDGGNFSLGDTFVVIEANNSTGQFLGLPEGAVAWSGQNFSLVISYVGGDGNDVTLTAVNVLFGDVNLDGNVDLLDVAPFVGLLSGGGFQAEADINQDGIVDLLDVAPFINILTGS